MSRPKSHVRWKPEEVERLRELYSNTSTDALSRLFGRPFSSIRSKAHLLGLKKSEERLRLMGRDNVNRRWTRKGPSG